VEHIELQFGALVFANLGNIVPLRNGFVSYYNESAYGANYGLLLISPEGKVVKKYDRRGNGPGEFNRISNIIVKGNSILVAEMGKPVIHVFDSDLNFVRDYRVKHSGKIFDLGKYIGVWSYNHIRERDVDKIYVISMYDSADFTFKGYAGNVDLVPDFVQYWGGIWNADKNAYALILPHRFQIYLLDSELKFKKKIISNPPGHVKHFTPWKKDKNHLNSEGFKWIQSWTKPFRLFYYNGKYLLISVFKRKQYLDVIDSNGKYIFSGIQLKEYCGYEFIKDGFMWLCKSDKEQSIFTLIKCKLKM